MRNDTNGILFRLVGVLCNSATFEIRWEYRQFDGIRIRRVKSAFDIITIVNNSSYGCHSQPFNGIQAGPPEVVHLTRSGRILPRHDRRNIGEILMGEGCVLWGGKRAIRRWRTVRPKDWILYRFGIIVLEF